MKKTFLATLFTSAALTLTGCGGGGGGTPSSLTVDPSGSFSGERSSATITNQNYVEFLKSIVGTANLQDISLRNENTTESSDQIRDMSTIASITKQYSVQNSAYQQRVVNQTQACSGGGSVNGAGNLDDNTRTGNLVMTFNSCVEDGVTLNGVAEVIFRRYNFSYDVPDSYVLKAQNLSVNNGTDSYTSTAVYDVVEDLFGGSATLLINAMNTLNGGQTLYENLQLDSDSNGVLISGRIYTKNLGYVDVITNSPLVYSFYATYPNSGGPILLAGQNSNIRITPIADETIQVELDLDGNDIYDPALIIDANGNVVTNGTGTIVNGGGNGPTF